jgi:hypothetical protein
LQGSQPDQLLGLRSLLRQPARNRRQPQTGPDPERLQGKFLLNIPRSIPTVAFLQWSPRDCEGGGISN